MDYSGRLKKQVIELSNNKDWEDAQAEWCVRGYFEEQDKQCQHSCICGKFGLKQLYEINNSVNGNRIRNVGSECMKQFKLNSKETYIMKVLELKHKILRAKNTKYDGKEFCEIVKDVDYIKFIKKYGKRGSLDKLIEYYDVVNQ